MPPLPGGFLGDKFSDSLPCPVIARDGRDQNLLSIAYICVRRGVRRFVPGVTVRNAARPGYAVLREPKRHIAQIAESQMRRSRGGASGSARGAAGPLQGNLAENA